jgi:hypothetical protein
MYKPLKFKIMKSTKFLFAVTILMTSLFSNVSAQNEKNDKSNITKFEQVQVSYDMKDMVTVEYSDALTQNPWKMKVRVYEESGKLLYSSVSRKKGNARVGYDISKFPAGNFTFELYKNRQLIYSKVIVKQASNEIENSVSVQNMKNESNFGKFQQAQISYDMKDLVTVEYSDALSQSPWKMKVRVYEESGKLLYSSVSRKKGNATVGYDISQFPAGNYTFELYKNRESVYSKDIVKQASIVIANIESDLNGHEDSSNLLLSKN